METIPKNEKKKKKKRFGGEKKKKKHKKKEKFEKKQKKKKKKKKKNVWGLQNRNEAAKRIMVRKGSNKSCLTQIEFVLNS